LILAPYIYFVYLDKSKEIKGLRANLSELENKLVIAKKKASQRNKLRMEMKKAQLQFNIAKKALPESEEIPTLLTSISHAGQDAGLEFLLFEPKPEKEAGFYAKIPVSMTVEGNYHDVAKFFNMVAGLSRIVNIVDIRMETDDKKREGVIKTSCKAITYRFIEQTQETAPSKNKS
jgi:type IV pilus assembly protein PilO